MNYCKYSTAPLVAYVLRSTVCNMQMMVSVGFRETDYCVRKYYRLLSALYLPALPHVTLVSIYRG